MSLKRLTIEYVRKQTPIIAHGYKCLSETYKNAITLLKFKCRKDHIFFKTWNNFCSNNICSQCSTRYRRTEEDVKKYCKEIGYELLSEYENTSSRIKVKCDNGHVYTTRADNLLLGHRCRECYYDSISINQSGENHYNWQGGKSYAPYCVSWTSEYKDYIKDRDGNNCMNPYCDSENPYNIVVHHINYNKKDCDQYNLITICNSCNVKANFNRRWHKAWYEAIIYNRYIRRM